MMPRPIAPGNRYNNAVERLLRLLKQGQEGQNTSRSLLIHANELDVTLEFVRIALRELEPLEGIKAVDDARRTLRHAVSSATDELGFLATGINPKDINAPSLFRRRTLRGDLASQNDGSSGSESGQ